MNALAMVVMVFASIALSLVGMAHLTQATQGVGFICLGAVAAILGRMAQAGHYANRETKAPASKPSSTSTANFDGMG